MGAGIGKTQQHALDPGLCSGACILGVLPHEKGRGEPRGPVAAGAAAAWRRGVLGGPGHPKIRPRPGLGLGAGAPQAGGNAGPGCRKPQGAAGASSSPGLHVRRA